MCLSRGMGKWQVENINTIMGAKVDCYHCFLSTLHAPTSGLKARRTSLVEEGETPACDVCGRSYVNMPHVLPLYGNAGCCRTCWQANKEGWSRARDASIRKLCKKMGISEPVRNNDGLFPRGD